MYEWLLIFGVVLWLGVCLWYWRQPIASTYHPISFYLIFHGVLFAIRPVLAWWLGFGGVYQTFQFDPTPDEKAVVLLAADLALLVFVAVAARTGNVAFSRAAPGRRGPPPRLDGSLLASIAVCAPLALVSLRTGLSAGADGANTMIMTAQGISINTTGNGYFNDAQLMLGPIAVLIAWAGRFRPWALVPLVAFVLAKAGTGGRWPFVVTVMSLALFWMYERRLRWPTPRLLLLAVPLIALFTIIGEDRGAGIRGLFGAAPVAARADYFHERPLEPMDYANMEFFEFLVHVVPKRTGTYDLFLTNLQILTEPVPRVLWPGKPVGPPIQLFSLQDYGRPTGMSLSVPGIGWLEAGWIGVVLWSALFGWAYGALYKAYVRSDQTPCRTAIYLILLPITLQTLRDGVLLTVLKTSFFPIVSIVLWWLLDRIAARTRARSPAGQAA